MTVHPVTVDEEWHERLKARLMERVRLRQRAAQAEARVAELEQALAAAEQQADQLAATVDALQSARQPSIEQILAAEQARDQYKRERDDCAYVLQNVADTRDAAEQARDRVHAENLALTERNLRQKVTVDWLRGRVAAAEQRATRLGALEAAARAWRRFRFREEGVDAAADLDEAVAALDAAPGEPA